MHIACLGGGPAGLYFSISMKLRDPTHDITVFERNGPNDTFGWGVVLSDDALESLRRNDPISAQAISDHFSYWDDMAVIHNGVRSVSGGHGFAGIGRKKMLNLLQERACSLNIDLRFDTEFLSVETYKKNYDLVVATDGLNSQTRNEYASVFKPDIDVRSCKFVWLGTKQKFNDAFTFIFEKTEFGWMWAHIYQFDKDTATFIVECSQDTFNNFKFQEMSKDDIIKTCETVFAAHLGGNRLLSNADHLRGSAVFMNFPRVLCEQWYHENIVLLGDASATAHFSIGSGTRLAFDSAIALADYLHTEPTLLASFKRYQDERRVEVLRLQSAARNSLEWFEDIQRYIGLHPVQFNYSLLTRSQRISHENLRLRDAQSLETAERWFQLKAGASENAPTRAPMFAPFKLRDMLLKNRIVVSPMAQYKALHGIPNDWHLIHYGERAKGGAGLVYTEMTCVSANGRITPGCPGLYDDQHETAWKKLTHFVHSETSAKLCCQIGHSGRKGSTKLGWEGMDKPLLKDNWELISASPIPWSPDNATPREMSRADMDIVTADFISATKMAERAGFDMIELHAAHGYLISSFISPLSNKRIDEYGGSLENRMRYPLEVIQEMRSAWPKDKPLGVRISAHDWVEGDGVTPDEAVKISKLFFVAGADIIDVSAGQTSIDAKPVYGRMFQTPFSDRIRNEAGLKTMAVGNIYEADHANSILMAGRADLVCIARGHLSDPYWTLRKGAEIGDRHSEWPLPYEAGRDQLWRLSDRNVEAIGKV
jgi:anthraniloyl-CoA monooxygenase